MAQVRFAISTTFRQVTSKISLGKQQTIHSEGLLSNCRPLKTLSKAKHTQVSSRIDLNENSQKNSPNLGLVFGATVLCSGVVLYNWNRQAKCKPSAIQGVSGGQVVTRDGITSSKLGDEIPKLPSGPIKEYSKAEVAKHNTVKDGIWVTYKGNVYDVTQFVEQHPGGDKIMLAAGGALEPFWSLYAVHNSEEVKEILQEMHIGSLKYDMNEDVIDIDDPFARDPQRHPALMINSLKPFNAEPPPELVVDSYITPNELFFVRNHLPVPVVDPKTFKLEIEFSSGKTKKFSLDDLKKFKEHTITASLQCAGNRRSEMSKYKPVKGLSWNFTAISNARWTGVLLRDVLQSAGVTLTNDEIKHVQFEGLDKDPTGAPYGASIAIEKALGPFGDVLLAYKMNGEELPGDHGFPLRVIVPGVVGARNVKWLSKIILSDIESQSHWQQNDYKGFSPSVDWDSVDFKKSVAVQDYPCQSAICQPKNGSEVHRSEETVVVKGYSWSGGGRDTIRVDVSGDGGKTWKVATLQKEHQTPYRAWAWSLWEVELPIPADGKKMEIICKSVDDSYNVQPDSVQGIWNLRGLLNNSWHHIAVDVKEE